MKWNNIVTSLIVLAQTEVDKSNKSYYGETNMYILSSNGGFDSRIDLGMDSLLVSWRSRVELTVNRQRRSHP